MGVRLPAEVSEAAQAALGSRITQSSSVSGGCINSGAKLTTPAGDFFIKWNDQKVYPKMFEVEAKGLALLGKASALRVPRVVHSGLTGVHQYLILEWVNAGQRSVRFWQDLGRGLAAIHRNTAIHYGLDHDNYMGSLPQQNTLRKSWIEFFTCERIFPQLKMAADAHRIEARLSEKIEAVMDRLGKWLPEENPALVHGDLWNGNLMVSSDGNPCLIDPAVYYGHREVDLAMMKLFGGVDTSCFEAYEEVYPLLPGFDKRVDLYNLYPLLVHVNLFGGGYAAQVGAVVNRFI